MADETYDLEAVYDEKIFPLMAQIIAVCKEHRMPLLCSFQYAVLEDGVKSYCTTFLDFDRKCKELEAATDIVRHGLPWNRPLALTVTTRVSR